MLTQARLKELLHYCPDSGVFTRRVCHGRYKAGTVMRRLNKDGYIRIVIDGKDYFAHRLAFLYIHGHFPPDQIDHRNGVRTDNRLNNLRPATNQQNQFNRNKPSNNSSGFKGVHFDKRLKKFQTKIYLNNRQYYLGLYETLEQASEAYNGFAKLVHGEFYRETA